MHPMKPRQFFLRFRRQWDFGSRLTRGARRTAVFRPRRRRRGGKLLHYPHHVVHTRRYQRRFLFAGIVRLHWKCRIVQCTKRAKRAFFLRFSCPLSRMTATHLGRKGRDRRGGGNGGCFARRRQRFSTASFFLGRRRWWCHRGGGGRRGCHCGTVLCPYRHTRLRHAFLF